MKRRVQSRTFGVFLLGLLTLVWGTTFVVIRDAVASFPPSLLVFLRFLIATVFFLPWFRRERGLALAGLELGLWLVVGYGTQAVGLVYTTVGRSAFITALSVVMVPLVAGALGRKVARRVWVGAGMALVGVGLLTYDGAPPNVGDLWTLMTALAYTAFILRLEYYARRMPPGALAGAQLLGVLLWSGLWVGLDRPPPVAVPWAAVLYLGVVATALATWLMTVGQAKVSAEDAAIIYALEPVWAALAAYLALGETLGVMGLSGATLVLAATVYSQLGRGAG